MNARVFARKQAQAAMDAANARHLAELERQDDDSRLFLQNFDSAFTVFQAFNDGVITLEELPEEPEDLKRFCEYAGIRLEAGYASLDFSDWVYRQEKALYGKRLSSRPRVSFAKLFESALSAVSTYFAQGLIRSLPVLRVPRVLVLISRSVIDLTAKKTNSLFVPLVQRPSVQALAPNA